MKTLFKSKMSMLVYVVFWVVFGISSESLGVMYSYNFYGNVTKVSDPILNVGDPFTGTFMYDFDLSKSLGPLGGGHSMLAGLVLDFGIEKSVVAEPRIRAHYYNGTEGSFIYLGNAFGTVGGKSSFGSFESVEVSFISSAYDAVTGLPYPDNLSITGWHFTNVGGITGIVSENSSAPVPEPSTFLLLVACFGGLILYRNRNKICRLMLLQ